MLFRIDAMVEDLPALGSKPFRATDPLRIDSQLLADAKAAYGESFRSIRKAEGDGSLRTLAAAYLYADSSLLTKDFSTAEAAFRWLLPQAEAVLGEEHPVKLYIVRELAEALDCDGRQSDADRMLDALVQQRVALHGPEDPATLIAISLQLARLERLGRYQEAIPSRQNLLVVQRSAYGSFHPQTINSMDALGVSLLAVQKSTEAKQIFASARAAAVTQLGQDSKIVKQLDTRLADVDARLEILNQPLKLVVALVRGNAQYRSAEGEPWRNIVAGMELAEGGELHNGVRSAVQIQIGRGQTCTIDGVGILKINRVTLLGAKFTSPSGVLEIRG
jgi:hypothetical protein